MNNAVYSMTGFATQTQIFGKSHAITLDIRSVNSRFLDIHFKLPECYRHLEIKLREKISKNIKRGKCEIKLTYQSQITESKDTPIGLIAPHKIEQLLAQQIHILRLCPQASPLSIADIIELTNQRTNDVLEQATDIEVLELAQKTIDVFMETRATEGKKLAQFMLLQITQLEQLRQQILPLIPHLIHEQRIRFLQKFHDALNEQRDQLTPNLLEERALSEAASFAIRTDITEELDRLGSHLTELKDVLTRQTQTANQEIGKRLEFLIQELHRETNTLSSKSASLEITKMAIDMKVLIEQLREQTQNIE